MLLLKSSGCLVALLFLFVCFAQCICTVQWDFFQSFLSKNSCQPIFCSALQIVCFSMFIWHPEANHSISKVNLLPYVLKSTLKLQQAQEHGQGQIWQLHSACWALQSFNRHIFKEANHRTAPWNTVGTTSDLKGQTQNLLGQGSLLFFGFSFQAKKHVRHCGVSRLAEV